MNNNPVSDNTKKTVGNKDDKFTIEKTDGIIADMYNEILEGTKRSPKKTFFGKIKDKIKNFRQHKTSKKTPVEQDDNFTIKKGSIVEKMLNEIKENPIKMSPETLKALRGTGKLATEKTTDPQDDNFAMEGPIKEMYDEINNEANEFTTKHLEAFKALRGTGKLPPKKVNKTELSAPKLVKPTKEIC